MLQSCINEKDWIYARRKADNSYFVDLYLVLIFSCLSFFASPFLASIKKMCRNSLRDLLYSTPRCHIQFFLKRYNYKKNFFYYCIDKRIIHNLVSLYKGVYIGLYKPLSCLKSRFVLSLFLPKPATGVAE